MISATSGSALVLSALRTAAGALDAASSVTVIEGDSWTALDVSYGQACDHSSGLGYGTEFSDSGRAAWQLHARRNESGNNIGNGVLE
jgi:hypothetical protein